MKKKIITIVGARPQIIKSSALSRAVATHFKEELEEIIVHTGQHYDENMSHVFFEEMKIPFPNYNLSVGSGSHGKQTAKMLEGLEEIFIKEKPDAVVVYGDTNSTIAGALAATKIHIPVVHIEAGLRSFNKAMPEEVNRIACDHMSSLLFTPTDSGIKNLRKEGFNVTGKGKGSADSPSVHHCGDIMYDNSLHFSGISNEKSEILKKLNLETNGYILCTVHRDSNTDIKENMESIFQALLDIGENSGLKIILPLHPRTKHKMKEQLSTELLENIANSEMIEIIDPAGFLDIIALEKNARMLVTDSGGLQKESFFFEKPCVILRPQTEWVEIVNNGNAILADADYDRIIDAFNTLISKDDYTFPSFYGDGKAAEFICQKIVEMINS
ncbi:MAG: UDP-N-acetylglucosamine 2-epimerase (non-hydrolyzing) [Fluviicola sp.]|nr:UDP-N-acetylglucosamine 2-epimerase (non-hydrolyzing) [Fluviicola sp.]